jgi:hypothetical protein
MSTKPSERPSRRECGNRKARWGYLAPPCSRHRLPKEKHMSFTRGRLRRIEGAVRGGPCPECKLSPDEPGYVVYGEGEERPKGPDERCPRCGRHLWFVIRVVYEDAREPAEGEEGGGDLRWP